MCQFCLKQQKLSFRDGLRYWEPREETVQYEAAEIAVIIVDMWDRHWSEGANRRCGPLADKINQAAIRAREKGMLIVHAPSDTMDFYRDAEARKRFLATPLPETIPEPLPIADHPLPIDDSDGGSDTIDHYPANSIAWTRQNEKIVIDQSRDLICGDEGERLYTCLTAAGVKLLIFMGVHTNMCILNRSFGIKNMLRRGFKTVLVRDLTDAMYNPERPPYVEHDEGTALVVGYIEKFYCPTIDSTQL
jgi:nicotinamidase-related amidase